MKRWMEQIINYNATNEQEQGDWNIMCSCIEKEGEKLLTRESELAHFTSSALVLNETKTKALLVHHNIYNAWSWPGGHVDGNTDFLKVALQEVQEETGLSVLRPLSLEVQSLDILPVSAHKKRGVFVSSHLHFSVGYLLIASEKEKIKAKLDENTAVRWVDLGQLDRVVEERHMLVIYKKLLERAKTL